MSARLSVTRQLDKKLAQIEIQIGRPKTGDSIILVPFNQLEWAILVFSIEISLPLALPAKIDNYSPIGVLGMFNYDLASSLAMLDAPFLI